MSGRFSVRTEHGYVINELLAALPKVIRRRDVKLATNLALEFLPKFPFALWRQLVSFAIIEVCDPAIANYIDVIRRQFFDLWGTSLVTVKTYNAFVGAAIYTLCLAKHSRAGLYLGEGTAQSRTQNKEYPELPDYVYDYTTVRGRALGRGMEYDKIEDSVETKELPSIEELRDIYWRCMTKPKYEKYKMDMQLATVYDNQVFGPPNDEEGS